MSLTGVVINFITRESAGRYEQAAKDPVRVQSQKLLDMVRRNSNTEYGQRFGYSSIKNITDYQREVQLTIQLTHPNTIEIYDYGRRGYFTMSWSICPG